MLASFVLAAPTIEEREAQVDGYIYICTDANWSGDCDNYGFINGQCSNFPSTFQNDISSVGPDPGWVCILSVDYNCYSDKGIYTVTWPGYSDLSQDWGNDMFNSVVCISS
ncbi:hypothetical protein A0H81_06641 [Grifola frondosa]|uniref:Beta/gamma crystallin 'Greek key' domain-containing protein n=1 Tax=Grifola frondosa TaxID=5627 RepID=A0A1C7MEQ5_GRIFR|nr:hypothetical protein A0H81_06641 [Grifola frondosa]